MNAMPFTYSSKIIQNEMMHRDCKPSSRLDHDSDNKKRYIMTCSFYHTAPLNKIQLQSVHNVLSNTANRQTDRYQKNRQINTQTNATENIISLAEVAIAASDVLLYV